MLNPVSAAEKPRKRKKWDVADPQGEPLQADPKKPSAFLRPNPQFPLRPTAQISPLGIQATAQAPGVRAPLPDIAVPEAMSAVEIAERAKRGALSVLNKINQDLKAKGALPPHIMHLVEESVSRQVVINDAPPAIRFNLTRRAVQDDIGRRTGTSVVVRGQYYSPGQVHGEEKPLHLKITPGVVLSQPEEVQQKAVDLAAQEIEHILSGGQPGSFVPPRSNAMGPTSAYPAQGTQWPPGHGPQRPASAPQPERYPPQQAPGQPAEDWPGQAGSVYQSQMYAQYPGLNNLQARPQSNHAVPPPALNAYQAAPPPDVPLYIGLEAPPEYNLPGRLLGPDGTYLRHISDQTGAQLAVRGRIAGRQEGQVPLHILVSGGTQAGHNEAVRLAKNLIDSIRAEHNRAFPNGYQPIRVSNNAAGQWNNAHPVHQSASYSHPSTAFSHPGMAPHGSPHGGFNLGQAPPQFAGSAQPVHSSQALQYPPPAYGSYQPTAQAPTDYQGRPAYSGAYSQAPAASLMPQHDNYYQQSQEESQVQSVHQQPQALGEGFDGSRAAPEDPKKPPPQEEAPKRRRFKEVKDRPPPVPESPAPYAPTVMGPPAPRKPGSMAPPPPRGPTSMGPPPSRPAPGPMGPPPPRLASSMGPPPPRLAPEQAAKPTGDQQEEDLVSGSLAGFLDY